MSYEKPYEGLKVIDFSQGVAGPYCGMLLAEVFDKAGVPDGIFNLVNFINSK